MLGRAKASGERLCGVALTVTFRPRQGLPVTGSAKTAKISLISAESRSSKSASTLQTEQCHRSSSSSEDMATTKKPPKTRL